MVEMKSAHGQTIKIITGSCGQWERHGQGRGKGKGKRAGKEKGEGKGKSQAKAKPKGMANWLERAKQWPYLNVSCLALTGLLVAVVAVVVAVVVVVIPAHHTLWPFLNLTDTSRQFQVNSPALVLSLPFFDSLSLSLLSLS